MNCGRTVLPLVVPSAPLVPSPPPPLEQAATSSPKPAMDTKARFNSTPFEKSENRSAWQVMRMLPRLYLGFLVSGPLRAPKRRPLDDPAARGGLFLISKAPIMSAIRVAWRGKASPRAIPRWSRFGSGISANLLVNSLAIVRDRRGPTIRVAPFCSFERASSELSAVLQLRK